MVFFVVAVVVFFFLLKKVLLLIFTSFSKSEKCVFILCSVPGPPKSTENDEYLEQYQCDDRGDKKKPRSFFFYLHIWLKYVLVRFSYKLLVRLWNFEFTLTLRSSLSLL